ncbi:F4 family fimbrial subunit [Shewanella gaetbuli]|uniref:Fimbrial protein n=1 Tax=Shewanella gaetbuli TaxID=220752 RepID=A0A9X1ZHH8_9GAMM|nr:hypothetical protein [Shewanella gaetbuli]MCL1141626.1 hypothetical protein [Shewanella gaetbuli]
MNKSKLALSAIALVVSSASVYAFTESPNGTFQGSLDFNGVITNTNPIWAYQIEPTSPARVKDLNAQLNEGQIQSDGSIVFDFSRVGTVPFVEGYMKGAAVQGGVGLSPVVTVLTSTGDIEVVGPNMAKEGIHNISLNIEENGIRVPNASLEMKLSSGTSGAATYNGQYFWPESAVNYGVAQSAMSRAVNLVLGSEPFAAIYAGKQNSAAASKVLNPADEGTWTIYDPSNVGYGLTRTEYRNVFGAFATTVSHIQLHASVNSVPDTWYATLPVNIVLQ